MTLSGTGTLSATVTGYATVTANFSGSGALSSTASSARTITGESFLQTQSFNDGTIDYTPVDLPINFDFYAPPVYRYFVFDIITDTILAEIEMSDVSFETKLCAVGEFSGTIGAVNSRPDVDMYWATMPMKTALYVLRNDVAVWGGVIWDRDYSPKDQTLKISAGTWESYLFRRYIWHTFQTKDDIDQYDVVRTILRKMRQDFSKDEIPVDDYVTRMPAAAKVDTFTVPNQFSGRTQNTMTFIREELKSFGEAITQYADNINGFEWNFQYHWNPLANRFRRRVSFRPTPPVLMPKGHAPIPDDEANKPGIDRFIFEYPGNIIDLTLNENADNACTRQFVRGGVPPSGLAGGGYGYIPIGSWNNYDAVAQGFPLVENVESSKHSSVTRQTRLNHLASIYGRQSAPPIRTWKVVVSGSADPIIGTYQVGDWCRLIINDLFIAQSLNAQGIDVSRGIVKRIIGMSVAVPNGAQKPEAVTLELEDDVVLGQLEEAETATYPSDTYPSG